MQWQRDIVASPMRRVEVKGRKHKHGYSDFLPYQCRRSGPRPTARSRSCVACPVRSVVALMRCHAYKLEAKRVAYRRFPSSGRSLIFRSQLKLRNALVPGVRSSNRKRYWQVATDCCYASIRQQSRGQRTCRGRADATRMIRSAIRFPCQPSGQSDRLKTIGPKPLCGAYAAMKLGSSAGHDARALRHSTSRCACAGSDLKLRMQMAWRRRAHGSVSAITRIAIERCARCAAVRGSTARPMPPSTMRQTGSKPFRRTRSFRRRPARAACCSR